MVDTLQNWFSLLLHASWFLLEFYPWKKNQNLTCLSDARACSINTSTSSHVFCRDFQVIAFSTSHIRFAHDVLIYYTFDKGFNIGNCSGTVVVTLLGLPLTRYWTCWKNLVFLKKSIPWHCLFLFTSGSISLQEVSIVFPKLYCHQLSLDEKA